MDATRRFSSRVGNYVRYRPGYPHAVLEPLRERYGLTARSVIADVGSGTGLLSRLFLEHGNRVFGVEPNPEMRRAGERFLGEYGGFASVDATAEETGLSEGSVDFVVAGQAFHWFDPGPTKDEFGRILRDGGRVVLIWNVRRKEGSAFSVAHEKLLRAHGTDYAENNHERRASPAEIRRFFYPQPVHDHVSANSQVCDWDAFKGRVLSSSYMPDEGGPGYAPMVKDLEKLFREFQSGGLITLEYDTRVHVGEIRAST